MRRIGLVLLALVLVLVACGDDDDGGDAEAPPVVGTTWQWVEFLGGDDSVEAPDDPSLYTLTLNDDGTAAIRADCNNVVASYEIDDPTLTLTMGPTTLAMCEEGSLGERFTQLLSNAASFVMDGDQFVISLFADAGTMHFTAG